MTRICSHCKKEMGEKCGNCGSEYLFNRPGWKTFQCLDCGYFFNKGDDGQTDGICPDCLAVELRRE